jgi:hypothetical protein
MDIMYVAMLKTQQQSNLRLKVTGKTQPAPLYENNMNREEIIYA